LFGGEAGAFSATEKDKNGKPKFVPSWSWRSTTKDTEVYIHLFEWPASAFHLDEMPRKVTGAYLLADEAKTPLKVSQNGDSVDIALPEHKPDAIATVLVLKTS
jgi:alpha-L-fucosidase